jgi:hypothetical protein
MKIAVYAESGIVSILLLASRASLHHNPLQILNRSGESLGNITGE